AHRLRPIEQAIRSRGMTTYDLDPIVDPEVIRQICTSGGHGRGDDVVHSSIIEERVIDAIVKAWEASDTEGAGPDRVGLLHLQSILYDLYHRADGGRIELSHLESLRPATGDDAPAELFRAGLHHAFARKLRHCEAACRSDHPLWDGRREEAPSWHIDRPLVDGTRDVVQRMVGHLSSGGYKLSREIGELMQQTMGREMKLIAPGSTGQPAADDPAIDLARRLTSPPDDLPAVDVLVADHDQLMASVGADRPPTGTGPATWLDVLERTTATDQDEVTAGVMLGADPAEVAAEEARRFAFAVAWLDAADLVRVTPLGRGRAMLSLIHDGFSAALEAWAAGVRRSPSGALTLVTAAVGETFDWRGTPEPWPELTGIGAHRIHANVRWRSCRVSADLTRIVFVNCDFRQTEFVECRFEGAVFVNCLLDGAMFSRCDIVGPVSPGVPPDDDAHRDEAPVFSVDCDDAEALETFARYGRVDRPAGSLLSATSGVPALPLEGLVATHPWHAEEGGLTMYGGRLCALMVRDCSFLDDGVLALRFVSGSSLDIVEQVGGRIDLYLSAVRGVSVSGPVGGIGRPEPLTIRAFDSVLADTWIGPGLVGAADIETCVVWNLFNASERTSTPEDGFAVHVLDSPHFGLVNVDPPDLGPIAGMGHEGLGDATSVRAKADEMAYRSHPGAYRLAQLRSRLSR
ncbi:MAG TPA: pentapeptide repeat-containing protein, partial [Iamia sp.]|nr:pentapeptide repeat-containing protein [Iamia sp.]